MNELAKINRLIENRFPQFSKISLITIDASIGQNSIVQAEEFRKSSDLSGAIMTKLDGTAKGGGYFPLYDKLKIPVNFVGLGEGIEDLKVFDPDNYVDSNYGIYIVYDAKSKNKKNVNLISLGCAKNMVDSEILLGGLNQTNLKIVKNPEEADTIIINTCGFLDIAREESINTILEAADLKNTGILKELVVMGCLSERYPNQIKEEIPEIDRIFGSNDHKQIVSFLTGKDFSKDDPLFFRSLMTPNHYAYIKIAEGCDNGCTFCSIPIMRGLQKSRTIPSIMEEAERLANNGTKELLVIAQDSTSYGWDLERKVYLSDLIKELNTIDGIDWIRIHYAHPAHLSQRIIDAVAECDKVCNYLDMPIQHAADEILKSMRRGLGQDGIRNRITRLRDAYQILP